MSKKMPPAAAPASAKKKKKRSAYKTITVNSTISGLSDALSEIEGLKDEMSEMRDNLEEKFSQTNKYQMASDAADALEGADLDIEVPEFIADVAVTYTESVNTRKRSPSRRVRLSNACSQIEAVLAAAQTQLDELKMQSGIEEEQRDELEEFISSIENTLGDVADVEFPGMYG